MLMLVIVFVVSDAIAKANFARESGFSEELQRSIDRSLPDAGVFLTGEAVKVFAGKVGFRSQEYVENQVALRRTLESFLLDMFEKNFLLFSHVHPLRTCGLAVLMFDSNKKWPRRHELIDWAMMRFGV